MNDATIKKNSDTHNQVRNKSLCVYGNFNKSSAFQFYFVSNKPLKTKIILIFSKLKMYLYDKDNNNNNNNNNSAVVTKYLLWNVLSDSQTRPRKKKQEIFKYEIFLRNFCVFIVKARNKK